MKHRYVVSVDTVGKRVSVREYAAAGENRFSLLCEEHFDIEVLRTAAEAGKEPLAKMLRTPNMYPAAACAMRIAEAIETLIEPNREAAHEMVIDDPDPVD